MLSRYYKIPKSDLCPKVRSILTLPFLHIPEKDDLSAALDIYEQHGVDFIDAFLFVRTKNRANGKILSFDKDFDKLSPVLRVKP